MSPPWNVRSAYDVNLSDLPNAKRARFSQPSLVQSLTVGLPDTYNGVWAKTPVNQGGLGMSKCEISADKGERKKTKVFGKEPFF